MWMCLIVRNRSFRTAEMSLQVSLSARWKSISNWVCLGTQLSVNCCTLWMRMRSCEMKSGSIMITDAQPCFSRKLSSTCIVHHCGVVTILQCGVLHSLTMKASILVYNMLSIVYFSCMIPKPFWIVLVVGNQNCGMFLVLRLCHKQMLIHYTHSICATLHIDIYWVQSQPVCFVRQHVRVPKHAYFFSLICTSSIKITFPLFLIVTSVVSICIVLVLFATGWVYICCFIESVALCFVNCSFAVAHSFLLLVLVHCCSITSIFVCQP